MIEKIISCGRDGAAKAALDVAIKLGLAHGGWCHAGQSVSSKYRLEHLAGTADGEVDEKAVAVGQGSLYFSHSATTAIRRERIQKIALRLNKPFMVANLLHENGFAASRRIAAWVLENRIRVLHVDGEAGQPDVAQAASVAKVLEATFFLAMMDSANPPVMQSVLARPERPQQRSPAKAIDTVQAALDHLEGTLSLKDRTTIANMTADELVSLHASLGEYVGRHFDLFGADSPLLIDCRHQSGRLDMASVEATAMIIRALWERLRATYRLRVVK